MMNLPAMAETNVENVWKTMAWAARGGDVPGVG